MTVTIEELIKEAVREGAMRRSVYPGAEGKPATKEHRLKCMDKIEAVLRAIEARPDIRAELEAAAGLKRHQEITFPSLL